MGRGSVAVPSLEAPVFVRKMGASPDLVVPNGIPRRSERPRIDERGTGTRSEP